MLRNRHLAALLPTALGLALAAPAAARDQIRIVGSSTVFPFATAVAEEFGRSTRSRPSSSSYRSRRCSPSGSPAWR